LDGNNAPFLKSATRPTLRTFYRDNATTPLTLAEDLCDITVEDLKGITYEINHKGSVHLGLDATPQPD